MAAAPDKAYGRFKLSLLAIAFGGLLLRLAPLVAMRTPDRAMDPNGDSAGYLELAAGLSHGCGFSKWVGGRCSAAPETNRTPGYPMLLMLAGNPRRTIVIQALMWAGLCLIVGGFAAPRWGPAAGLLAAGLIAADIPSIVYSAEIMSETLFTMLFVAGVVAELTVVWDGAATTRAFVLLAFASVMFALAAIVRPIGEFTIVLGMIAPLALAGVPWVRRAQLAITAVAAPILCIAGWTLRNYYVAGIATFCTISSLNFFYYRALGTLAFATGTSWQQVVTRTGPQTIASANAAARRIILAHPAAFAAMTLWSFVYLCLVPDRGPLAQLLGIAASGSPDAQDLGSQRLEWTIHRILGGDFGAIGAVFRGEFYASVPLLLTVLLQILMLLMMWGGVVAAIRRHASWRSRAGRCVLFAFAAALAILLLASGPEAEARLRIPAMPLMAMLAGIGWSGRITQPGERGCAIR